MFIYHMVSSCLGQTKAYKTARLPASSPNFFIPPTNIPMSSPAVSPIISFTSLCEAYTIDFEALKASVAAISAAPSINACKAAVEHASKVLVSSSTPILFT